MDGSSGQHVYHRRCNGQAMMANAKIIGTTDFRSRIQNVDYPITRISYSAPFGIKVKEDLPFRVKFINVGIESYNEFNIAPIGIAVIGFNNYVL